MTLARTVRAAARRLAAETPPERPEAEEEEEDDAPPPSGDPPVDGDPVDEEAEGDPVEEAAEDEDPAEGEQARSRGSRRASRGMSAADMRQVVELCAIAGTSAQAALGFIAKGASLRSVRAELAAQGAGGGSASKTLNPHRTPRSATAGWDEAIDKANSAAGVKPRQ